jgi:hypothetical protein
MSVNIPKQPLPEVRFQKIEYNLSDDSLRRYIVRRYDGKFTEVSQRDYNRYKDNPYFEKVIIKWYIRGTEDFVRTSNQKELDKAEQKINGIKNLIVNPLQLYQGV